MFRMRNNCVSTYFTPVFHFYNFLKTSENQKYRNKNRNKTLRERDQREKRLDTRLTSRRYCLICNAIKSILYVTISIATSKKNLHNLQPNNKMWVRCVCKVGVGKSLK